MKRRASHYFANIILLLLKISHEWSSGVHYTT